MLKDRLVYGHGDVISCGFRNPSLVEPIDGKCQERFSLIDDFCAVFIRSPDSFGQIAIDASGVRTWWGPGTERILADGISGERRAAPRAVQRSILSP